MKVKEGDLVACYLTNTGEHETLLEWGIVLKINPTVGDVYVVTNHGTTSWYPSSRWRILQSKNSNKVLDLDIKPV